MANIKSQRKPFPPPHNITVSKMTDYKKPTIFIWQVNLLGLWYANEIFENVDKGSCQRFCVMGSFLTQPKVKFEIHFKYAMSYCVQQSDHPSFSGAPPPIYPCREPCCILLSLPQISSILQQQSHGLHEAWKCLAVWI